MDHPLQGQRLGNYQVVARLGAGGMGEVYRARDLKLGRDVAIKVLPERFTADPDRLMRFKREARVLAALNHPRVAAIYELEEVHDSFFLVLELVEGETLEHRIARGPLRIDHAIAIALQIGEALEAAHARGIVHRDLKPANVMLQRSAVLDAGSSDETLAQRQPPDSVGVKVLDFGLAKATTSLAESPTVTAEGTAHPVIMGTTAYMSPEQARGRSVDARTDIWSFGVVIYEMVAGRVPFAAGEAHAVLYSIIHTPHEPLTSLRTDVPTELDRIVGKALAKDAGDRYQHVDDLLVDLRTLLRRLDAPLSGAGTPHVLRTAGGWRRNTAIAFVALLVLLLGAASAALWLRNRTVTEERPVRRFSMQLGNVRPVVSPDGRHIAYRRDGTLWIRDLDSETPREIPGGKASGEYYSDTAYYLTWSPDSRDLAFPAEGELRRVSTVQGGSAKTICEFPSGRGTGRKIAGLAWSGDGRTIVFSRYDAGIYEVPADGGSPTLLWKEAHADDLILLDTPQGRAVVYATLNEAAAATAHSLIVRTPDGQRREIAPLDTNWPELVYSPSGHILFRKASIETPSIWAVPISPTLHSEGEPFLVERTGLGMSIAAEGTFVYLDFGRSLGQVLAWRDRSGRVLTQAKEGHETIRNFSLSPAGNRAVANAVDGGSQGLWLYDLSRFTRTRFDPGSEAENSRRVLGGYWLEDNQVYYTVLVPPAAYQLRAAPVDGFGAPRTLSFHEGLKVVTDRTKDGRYLIVSHRPDSTRPTGIWLLRTTAANEAGERIDFSRNSQAEMYGTLSPDERYLAYTSDISGRVEVYVRPFPEGPGRWQISSDGGGGPVWGPAGNELFFATATELMRVRVSTTGPFSVHLPAESVFTHAPLLVLEAPAPRYAVSPDGKRFLTVEHKSEFSDPVVRVVENWLAEFRRAHQSRRD